MIPLLVRFVTRYVPMITVPAAAVIGVIGYNIESLISDKYTPFQESIQEKRLERLAKDPEDLVHVESLKEKKFVPSSVFEKNLSPSLK